MTRNGTLVALATVVRRWRWRVAISRLGIVDREYYEALTGTTFADDRDAIRHYLTLESDAALGLSLSPLIEASWQSREVPGIDASWYAVLSQQKGLWATSPYFDAQRFEAGADPGLGATKKSLRRFLRSAMPDTPMPMSSNSRGAAPDWARARGRAIEGAREYAAQLHLRRPRTAATWDHAAENGFVEGVIGTAEGEDRRVSIIMPTRDRKDSIEPAVESVRAQTYGDWELLIVDDGSTDGTVEVLRRLATEDRRIRVISTGPRGVSAARNAAVAAASGGLIAFLDSDNTWRPRFLEISLAGMRARRTDAVYSAVVLHRDDGETRYRGIQGTRDDLLYAGNVIDLNSFVLTRSLMEATGGFDEELRRWVDYDLFLTLTRTVVPSYLPFLGVDYDDRSSSARVTGSESASWEDVVLGKHLIDWDELSHAQSARSAGATVVIPTYGDWELTATAVRAVLDHSGPSLDEVIVIDNGSRRHVSAILRGLFGDDTGVRVIRMPRNLNFALANNVAVSLSRGKYIVALNNDTEVTEGWLDPLLAPLAEETVLATQPLLLYPDGTVQTAGTVFLAGEQFPQHFLAHHPVEDALRVTDSEYSAVTAAAMAMRASDFIRLHGFDPMFTNGLEDVDFCLRARRLRAGGFRVVTESIVYHHEGKTPDRARAVGRNRVLFLERWAEELPPSDDWRLRSRQEG